MRFSKARTAPRAPSAVLPSARMSRRPAIGAAELWSLTCFVCSTLFVATMALGQPVVMQTEQKVSKPTPFYSAPMNDQSPRIAVVHDTPVVVWNVESGPHRAAWTSGLGAANEEWRLPSLLGLFENSESGRENLIAGLDVTRASSGHLIGSFVYCNVPRSGPGGYGIAVFESIEDTAGMTWKLSAVPTGLIPYGELEATTLPELPSLASGRDGSIHLTYAQRRHLSQVTESLDHSTSVWYQGRIGDSWTPLVKLAEPTAEGPRVAAAEEGSVLVIWHDMAAGKILGRRWIPSASGGGMPEFGDPIVLGAIQANYSLPPRYDDYDYRLNRVNCELKLAPTYPAIAVDRSRGPRNGWMYAVWAESMTGIVEPVTGTVQDRDPNGNTWNAQRIEIGQEVIGTSSRGGPHQGGSEADLYSFEGRAGETVQISGEMVTTGARQWWWCGYNVLLSRISPDGRTLHGAVANGRFAHVTPRANLPILYTIPADGLYLTHGAGAVDDNQSVSYRLRVQRVTKAPESVARDQRDIVMVVSKDGGQTWSEKRLVNDDPPRFDNFMPEVAVDSLGRVHVTWYDRRDDTDYGMNYHVYWTWSEDGGESFVPSRALSATQSVLSSRPLDAPSDPRNTLLGERMGLCGTEEGIYGAWTFSEDFRIWRTYNEHNIRVRRADVPPTAVVADLAAQPAIGRTDLTWRITDPNVLWRFDVERRESGAGAEFSHLATVERAADIRTERYGYTDTTVEGGVDYEYRVVLHLANGRTRPSDPVSTTVPPTPTTLVVRAAESLPDGTIRLQVTAPAKGTAELRLFDVQGSLVRSLPPAEVEPGDTLIEWDGRDDRGQRPGSGVYFLEVRLGEARATTKLVLTGG